MINFIRYFYQYTRLIYKVYNYINNYNTNNSHNILLLDDLIKTIRSCGSVAIKFSQWITPKLEIIHLENDDILDESKPLWLKKLEDFYENCENHDLNHTIKSYQEDFNESLSDNYEILDIIGSGSIGQVYLLKEKPLTHYSKPKKYVMKILHPNVHNEIYYFRLYYNFCRRLPFIKNLLNSEFPFDINSFIDSFDIQSNFIYESNNLLRFQENYRNNEYIIIPRLIRCSRDIMIMSYEEGISYDDLKCDNYHKYKIAVLLTSFIRNNQQICNFFHGDLHKGNWKVRLSDDNKHKLILYDFGFCWKVPEMKKDKINLSVNIFEDCDENDDTIDYERMTTVLCYLLKYDNKDKDKYYKIVYEYLKKNNHIIKPWSLNPSRIFKLTVELCKKTGLKIDPMLIQTIIIVIQCQRIFQEFRFISDDKQDYITSQEVYRVKYMDWLSFYQTYNIFPEFSEYIKERLNNLQSEINNVFECNKIPDSFKNLALKHK
jgi:predicted unusual protein kinase regulating ubiquinone biosynthesis (AarF/ABC1/UbiB family)